MVTKSAMNLKSPVVQNSKRVWILLKLDISLTRSAWKEMDTGWQLRLTPGASATEEPFLEEPRNCPGEPEL